MKKDQIVQVFTTGIVRVDERHTVYLQGVLLKDGRMFAQAFQNDGKGGGTVVWAPFTGPDTKVK